jgi:hypothetical protein
MFDGMQMLNAIFYVGENLESKPMPLNKTFAQNIGNE